jgi:hypothetical protein
MPGEGTCSFWAAIAWLAAVKNAAALQAPTWVNDENSPLMFSPAVQLACCRIASWVAEAAAASPGLTGGAVVALPVAGALAVAAAVPLDVGVGVCVGVCVGVGVCAGVCVGVAVWVGALDADDVADGEPDVDGDGFVLVRLAVSPPIDPAELGCSGADPTDWTDAPAASVEEEDGVEDGTPVSDVFAGAEESVDPVADADPESESESEYDVVASVGFVMVPVPDVRFSSAPARVRVVPL